MCERDKRSATSTGKQVAQAERHPGYGVMPIVCRGEDFIDMLLTREKTDKI